MKITKVERPAKSPNMQASALKTGQVGLVLESSYTGIYVIRSDNRISDVSNPGLYWGTDCTLEVELLPKGTKITLEV